MVRRDLHLGIGDDAMGINPIEAMGLSMDDVLEADRKILSVTKKGKRDRRICLCGHAVARHSEYAGHLTCKPSAMLCPCKAVKPVIEVDDIRAFLRRTEGAGAMHALTRGIAAAVSSGKEVTWIVELKCDKCGKASSNVVPAAVTQSGRLADGATGYDALICHECRVSM